MPENFLLIDFLHMSSLLAFFLYLSLRLQLVSAVVNANDGHYAEINFYMRLSPARQSLTGYRVFINA